MAQGVTLQPTCMLSSHGSFFPGSTEDRKILRVEDILCCLFPNRKDWTRM